MKRGECGFWIWYLDLDLVFPEVLDPYSHTRSETLVSWTQGKIHTNVCYH